MAEDDHLPEGLRDAERLVEGFGVAEEARDLDEKRAYEFMHLFGVSVEVSLVLAQRRGASDGHAARNSAEDGRRLVVAEVNVCMARDVCEQRAQRVFRLLLR